MIERISRAALTWRILGGILAGLICGTAISEATYFFLRGGENRAPQVIEVRIPRGTADKVSAGERDPSLPTSLTFVIGDTLVVRNEDTDPHQLGPLFIPPGTTASMRLDTIQRYAATCSFQPTRTLGISIQAPLTPQTRALGILQAGVPLGLLFVLYGVFAVPMKSADGP